MRFPAPDSCRSGSAPLTRAEREPWSVLVMQLRPRTIRAYSFLARVAGF